MLLSERSRLQSAQNFVHSTMKTCSIWPMILSCIVGFKIIWLDNLLRLRIMWLA